MCFPTTYRHLTIIVRIPYAERELATNRAVLLDCQQAQCLRPEVPAGASGIN